MEALLFWCFTLLVCLAPLPFGGNEPWAWSLLALLLGLLALLWGLSGLVSRGLVTLRSSRTLPYALAMLLLTAWFLLQATSWTPAVWHHPAWAETTAVLGINPSGALSLTPDRTLTALMRLLSYGASFWLALHLLRRRRHARRFLWALVVIGVAYALYGLSEQLSGSRMVLWVHKYSYAEALTSSFINRNSYAAYAGMGLVTATGLLLDRLNQIWVPRDLGWRVRLVTAIDGLGLAVWLLVAAFLLLLTALVLTGSKGGALATLAGLVAVVLLVGRRRGLRTLLALGLMLGLGGLVVLQSGVLLGDRLADVQLGEREGQGDRLALYALALQQIAERPLAGSGLGSFAGVFLEQRGPQFGLSEVNHVRVHNSYLEVLMEAGLPAGLLLLALPAIAFFLQLRGLSQRGVERHFPAIVAAVTVLLAVHSLMDFSLQMPAIAITYAALLGLGVAQAYPHRTPAPAPLV